MTETDATLLELARAGDRTAFGKLVRKHHARVHRLALHLTGSRGEADDVTQETFVRAWRAIERFDGRAELFTWLYRICVNVALNLRRSRKRETTDINDPRLPEPVAEGVGTDPHSSAAQSQAYRALLSAMDSLSESLRTTLVLACVEQVPYADIAESLGCSEGTVAWRVHEARRKLRETLGDEWLTAMDAHAAAEPKKGGSRGR
jgi:RNA polymerase sigma-70 factor (ECF subfamily)